MVLGWNCTYSNPRCPAPQALLSFLHDNLQCPLPPPPAAAACPAGPDPTSSPSSSGAPPLLLPCSGRGACLAGGRCACWSGYSGEACGEATYTEVYDCGYRCGAAWAGCVCMCVCVCVCVYCPIPTPTLPAPTLRHPALPPLLPQVHIRPGRVQHHLRVRVRLRLHPHMELRLRRAARPHRRPPLQHRQLPQRLQLERWGGARGWGW